MSASFLDSNVLIYMFDEAAPEKQEVARGRVAQALVANDAVISFQVVQETLNTITRKIRVPLTADQAALFLAETLVPLWQVNPSTELYRKGLEIHARYRYGFYDSLIVAAALEAGCQRLYSEDFQHGQQIGPLTIENPFR